MPGVRHVLLADANLRDHFIPDQENEMTVPNSADNPASDTIADIDRVIATLPADSDTPYTAELWAMYRELAVCLAAEPVDAACALESMERILCLSNEDTRSWAFQVAGRLA